MATIKEIRTVVITQVMMDDGTYSLQEQHEDAVGHENALGMLGMAIQSVSNALFLQQSQAKNAARLAAVPAAEANTPDEVEIIEADDGSEA